MYGGVVRGFQYERFITESRRSEGWRTEPEGGEATGVAGESGEGEEWCEAASGSVRVVVQGKGLVCEYEEDDVPAEGRLGIRLERAISLLIGRPRRFALDAIGSMANCVTITRERGSGRRTKRDANRRAEDIVVGLHPGWGSVGESIKLKAGVARITPRDGEAIVDERRGA